MRTILPDGSLAANDGFVVTAIDTIQLTEDGKASLTLECRAEDGRPFLHWLVISIDVLINWLATFLTALERSITAQPIALARIGN